MSWSPQPSEPKYLLVRRKKETIGTKVSLNKLRSSEREARGEADAQDRFREEGTDRKIFKKDIN